MADQSVEQGSANRADGDNEVGIARLDYAVELLMHRQEQLGKACDEVMRLASGKSQVAFDQAWRVKRWLAVEPRIWEAVAKEVRG